MPSPVIKAGELNRRIQLQDRTDVADAAGGVVALWNTTATVWAKVEPLSGRLLDIAQQRAAEADTAFTIRYRTGLSPYTRILYASVVYEILWRDILGFNEGLQILARRFDPQPAVADVLVDFDDDEIIDFDGEELLVW